MTSRMIHLLPFALLAVLAGACSKPAPATEQASQGTPDAVTLDSAQAASLATAVAERTTFRPAVLTTGTVHFNGERSTAVIAPISGPVSRLVVALGDQVRPGDALALVASPDFAAAVADYRKATTAWANAKRIADLNDKLLATGALPRAERDQSAADLAEATADLSAARSALHALGITESALGAGSDPDSVAAAIRAPIAGTVVERLITPGQLLEAGATAAFTIADLNSMWVDANVFGADLAAVRRGDRALITTEASTDTFPGRVDYVGALVDPDTKATAVRIVVPNPGHQLRENMLVRVRITSATPRDGVLVPVSAVLRDDENLPFLFVQTAPGRFRRQQVGLGQRTDDRYEITSGLQGGETVVTEGGLFLAEAGTS